MQSQTLPGLFPFNKFSAVPVLTRASRLAQSETGGIGVEADARKRLMVVTSCRVLDLMTATQDDGWVRVTGVRVRDRDGSVRELFLAPPRPDGTQGVVVIGLGTIESTHLPPATSSALQASALFVKGKALIEGRPHYFHLQITASGLSPLGVDSEAELFKTIPDIEHIDAMLRADDQHVVITLRGIGEMTPGNPDSKVELAKFDSESGRPAAYVEIGDAASPSGGSAQTQADRQAWEAMDVFVALARRTANLLRLPEHPHQARPLTSRRRRGSPPPPSTTRAPVRRIALRVRGAVVGRRLRACRARSC